jgi:hypothetical protein
MEVEEGRSACVDGGGLWLAAGRAKPLDKASPGGVMKRARGQGDVDGVDVAVEEPLWTPAAWSLESRTIGEVCTPFSKADSRALSLASTTCGMYPEPRNPPK